MIRLAIGAAIGVYLYRLLGAKPCGGCAGSDAQAVTADLDGDGTPDAGAADPLDTASVLMSRTMVELEQLGDRAAKAVRQVVASGLRSAGLTGLDPDPTTTSRTCDEC